MPVRTRVGHSFIKAEMAETGAVFGGEHSAHYYFADFFRADTGMLAALHVLAALGGQDRPLSELVAEYERYSRVGRDQHARSPTCPAKLAEIRRVGRRARRRRRRARRADRHAAGRSLVQRAGRATPSRCCG